MKLLLDLNLSPAWVPFLQAHGVDAVHWSEVGDSRAPDSELLRWARKNERLLFTHDLDFAALLAATRATGPSVLQVRTQDVLPEAIGPLVLRVLEDHRDALANGAILSVDVRGARVRVLPIEPSG